MRGLLIFISFFTVLLAFGSDVSTVSDNDLNFYDTIALSNEAKLIGEEVYHYKDETGELQYNDILKRLNEFEKGSSPAFFDKASVSKIWFSFYISNYGKDEYWLDISNSNLTNLDLYKFTVEGELLSHEHRSCLSDEGRGPFSGYTFQYKLLPIEATTTNKIHVLIGVTTNLAFEVPLFVGTSKALSKNRSKFDSISIFTIGAIFILAFYNLFLAFTTKDKIYLVYGIYLFIAPFPGSYLNNFPFIEDLLGGELTHRYLDTWLWTLFAITGYFFISYFDLKKTKLIYYKVIFFYIFGFIFLGILTLFIPLASVANFYQIWVVLFFVTCLAFAYLLVVKGYPGAKLYSLGWSFMMLGAILYILVYNGYLPYNAFTRNISYFGTLVEVVIFSIALGRRINMLKVSQEILNKELLAKNEKLSLLNESLDSFNYHVSHDLKTVMNNTLSLSRMAKKYNDRDKPEKVSEIIGKLVNVAEGGNETVLGFLELAKVESFLKSEDKKQITYPVIEIEKILDRHNLKESIQVKVQANGVDKLIMHPQAFESIVLNLLTNSIKYNERSPEASIVLSEKAGQVFLTYSDNGIGIDLEKSEKDIFKPFVRIETKIKKEGTGIGLYLIRKIITAYDGDIRVESDGKSGTTFIINLPRTSLND